MIFRQGGCAEAVDIFGLHGPRLPAPHGALVMPRKTLS